MPAFSTFLCECGHGVTSYLTLLLHAFQMGQTVPVSFEPKGAPYSLSCFH